MFARPRSFISALIAAALTFALSFSGAVFDSTLGSAPAAAAITPCPAGWTFITAAGTYKDHCYNEITAAAAETLTVPAGVIALAIEALGGGGGKGGDAIDSPSNNGYGANGGAGGSLAATMTVTGGQVIGFYPGGIGTSGAQYPNSTNPAGGVSTYSAAYNGGSGKAATGVDAGGGGGGGAATIVTRGGAIEAIVAGGGGGGGAGYCNAGGTPGTSHVSYGANTAGEVATASGGAFQGSGGGGGAGAVGGKAGGVGTTAFGCFYTGYQGLGGAAGSSTSTFGTPSTHSTVVSGSIKAYFSPLPVAEVTLTSESTPPTKNSWTYRVEFAPDVTGLEIADFTMLEEGVAANGWTLSGLTGGPSIWTVVAAKSGLANGTNIALQVDQAGVRTVAMSLAGTGTSQSSDFAVDTVAPTAGSVTITPDLNVNKKIHVDIVFSETL